MIYLPLQNEVASSDANLLLFLDAVDNYNESIDGLENAIKNQKDNLTTVIPFEVTLIDSYISGALIEDSLSNIAEENRSNPAHYIFPNTPFREISASGGEFEANNSVSNQMNLKAPPLSRGISPITTLLINFSNLADELTVALNVTEEQLRGNFI